MKTILTLTLTLLCFTANAEIVARNMNLDVAKGASESHSLRYMVDGRYVDIVLLTGEVNLNGIDPEVAGKAFWERITGMFSELQEKSSGKIKPTHLQFGSGRKRIIVDVKSGRVRWPGHIKLSDDSKEFWDQVVLAGKARNKTKI